METDKMNFAPSSLARFTSVSGTFNGVSKLILKQVGIVAPKKVMQPRSPPLHAIAGTKNEKSVKELYAEQTGNIIEKLSIKKEFTHFKINGRCDGVTTIGDKQYIVEIKTRSTNKFGMTKPERVQCLAYCVCENINGLIFIEQGTSKELVISTYDNFLLDYIILWTIVEHDLTLLCNFINKFKANQHKYLDENNKLMYEIVMKDIYWV
jgi:hypothetical protein